MQIYETIPNHQYKAVVMSALGYDIQEIADVCDVNYRTIQNWRKNPGFQKMVQISTNALFDKSISRLSLIAESAAEELEKIIKDPETPKKTKLSAISIFFNVSRNFKQDSFKLEGDLIVALHGLLEANLIDYSKLQSILEILKQQEENTKEGLHHVFNK